MNLSDGRRNSKAPIIIPGPESAVSSESAAENSGGVLSLELIWSFECPGCGALPGAPCTYSGKTGVHGPDSKPVSRGKIGKTRDSHTARSKLAEQYLSSH